MQIRCRDCRHLTGVGFEAPDSAALDLLQAIKSAHGACERGRTLDLDARLIATLYSGWALERRIAPDGQLRAARILLPGDMIGLASLVRIASPGDVYAATDITFCSFDGARISAGLRGDLATRLLRVAVEETAEAAAALAALRTLPALGRTAWLIRSLYARLARRRLARDGTFLLPIKQRDLSEILGLTPVHLRRSCAALLAENAARFSRDRVTILDPVRLDTLAGGPAVEHVQTLF